MISRSTNSLAVVGRPTNNLVTLSKGGLSEDPAKNELIFWFDLTLPLSKGEGISAMTGTPKASNRNSNNLL
jgi:hypothetical protein